VSAASPGWLERVLRRVYLGFPLGWQARLRIKRALFTRMAPLLGGTGAYRRWQAAEREVAAQASLAQSQDALAALDQAPLQRRGRGLDPSAAAPLAPASFGRRHGLKLLLVVHDAHPHGAQYLALNLLGELVDELGLEVQVLLLGPGPLAPAFARLAVVHSLDAGDAVALRQLAAQLHADGYRAALANSMASGRVVRGLAEAGLRVLTLAHELPGLIRAQELGDAVAEAVAHSHHVVVPSAAVAAGLAQFADPAAVAARCVQRPQGLFVRSPHFGGRQREQAAGRLRTRLGLPADAKIVLAVGYADARKGVDLFAAALALSARRDARVHGVWVGHQDAGMRAAAEAMLAAAGLPGHLHFVGLEFDTADHYAGADVYALTSREDPFPSVLLEALSVGTPAVAFAGTGGGADLLESIAGETVPAFDTGAFSQAIDRLLADPGRHAARAQQGIALVERGFCFRRYAIDLLALAGLPLPRVSVVVPNYNYGALLRARLASIAGQDLPVYEIIVLDDASGDDSVERLQDLRAELAPIPQLHLGQANSGSVFRQWARGVALARGDFVWIAEADDLATPGFLESLVPAMQLDASIVMAYCQSRPIDAGGAITATDYSGWTDDLSAARWKAAYTCAGGDEVQAALAVKNTIPNASAVVFRRETLLAVLQAHLDEIVSFPSAGDWVTYLRVLQHGRIRFDPRPGNLHRRHRDSVVAGRDPAAHLAEVRAVQALARRLYPLDEASRAAAQAYAASLQQTLEPSDLRMKGGQG
jgi:GT2 family glycosyltransferase